jgi:magnesium-transporting ATPase (P-type)
MASLNFMKISSLLWFKDLAKYYHIPQKSDELKNIGLDSTSSYENLLNFMILLFIIILTDISITLITMILKLMFYKAEYKFLLKMKAGYLKVMRYSFYMRAFLMVYQFIILTSVDEIYKHNFSSISKNISFLFALFILIFCIVFFILSICLILSRSTLLDKKQPLEELYLGSNVSNMV